MGMYGQSHSPAALTSERHPVSILQEDGWTSWPVWTGAQKLLTIGVRTSDCQAGSEAQY